MSESGEKLQSSDRELRSGGLKTEKRMLCNGSKQADDGTICPGCFNCYNSAFAGNN